MSAKKVFIFLLFITYIKGLNIWQELFLRNFPKAIFPKVETEEKEDKA